jgi:uncharacterized protein YdbL (DUF1318 family)
MKHTHTITVLAALLISVICLAPAQAQGIKERMKQRLPVIVELKTRGIVGENNQGYLAFVTGKKSHEALVRAENQDRKSIYAYIAKQQKVPLSLVEKRRAITLAQRARPGEFIQKPDGSWIKK